MIHNYLVDEAHSLEGAMTSDLALSRVSLQMNKLGSIDALVHLINYSSVSLFKVN